MLQRHKAWLAYAQLPGKTSAVLLQKKICTIASQLGKWPQFFRLKEFKWIFHEIIMLYFV